MEFFFYSSEITKGLWWTTAGLLLGFLLLQLLLICYCHRCYKLSPSRCAAAACPLFPTCPPRDPKKSLTFGAVSWCEGPCLISLLLLDENNDVEAKVARQQRRSAERDYRFYYCGFNHYLRTGCSSCLQIFFSRLSMITFRLSQAEKCLHPPHKNVPLGPSAPS